MPEIKVAADRVFPILKENVLVDGFHLVMDTIDRVPKAGEMGVCLKEQLKDKLIRHRQYIHTHGEDMPEILNWKWDLTNE